MYKNTMYYLLLLVILSLNLDSCGENPSLTPTPIITSSPEITIGQSSCPIYDIPDVPESPVSHVPDETGLLLMLDTTASVNNCDFATRTLLTRLPIFSVSLAKDFVNNNRPAPHIAVSTFNSSGIQPLLQWDSFLNSKSPYHWYDSLSTLTPTGTSGEDYKSVFKSGLSTLGDTKYDTQKLLIITDGSFKGSSEELYNQIQEGIVDITSIQDVSILLLCPAQVTDLEAWDNYAKLDGKIKVYRTSDETWFQTLVKELFDGFLLSDEMDNFISAGQEVISSVPVLGVHKLHTVSLFEGPIEQNPGKNFLADGEVQTQKSITVKPDFSKGVCGKDKSIKNSTRGNIFYWYSPMTTLTPNVEIEFFSMPNEDNLKFKTILTIPEMSNGELFDVMRCIRPEVSAKKQAEVVLVDKNPSADLLVLDSFGRIKSEWIWNDNTPPDSLMFNIYDITDGNLIYKQSLLPRTFVRNTDSTDNSTYWTFSMDVWFPFNLSNSTPVKALSDSFQNTSGESDFPPGCVLEDEDTDFYEVENHPVPFKDEKDTNHPIVFEWVANAISYNTCKLEIDVEKETFDNCGYNKFQIVWQNAVWECISSDGMSLNCTQLP